MPLSLVLLAAGLGSRYGGPKQLDPLGPHGATLMDYAAFDAARAGFSRLVVVTRRALVPAVQDTLVRRCDGRLDVMIAEQELDRIPDWAEGPAGREAPWGTAHAVLVAREHVPGPFAVVNADDFYGAASYRVLAGALRDAEAQGSAAPWANVAFPLRVTMSDHGSVNRAVCETTPDGWLTRVVEQRGIVRAADGTGSVPEPGGGARALPAGQLVSMNCWAFTPTLFTELDTAFTAFLRAKPGLKDECLLPTVVNDALAAGRARARLLATEGPWCGVTHREDRPATVAALAALHATGVYPDRLFA